MLLNLVQRAGLRKCDMGNWVAREEMIGVLWSFAAGCWMAFRTFCNVGRPIVQPSFLCLSQESKSAPVLGLRRVLPVVQTHDD